MANEASIVSQLTIRVGNLFYVSQPATFQADVSTARGPSPGLVNVPLAGVDLTFPELIQPGFCRIGNIEDTGGNFFEWGVYEPATATFYPIGEVRPGEFYVIRLSRNLLEQYAGSGTGTTGPENKFRLKANKTTVKAIVEAFEG